MQSQWRTTGVGTMSQARLIRTGLDYAAVEPAARMLGLDLTPADFAGLRVMEDEALNVFAEKAAR